MHVRCVMALCSSTVTEAVTVTEEQGDTVTEAITVTEEKRDIFKKYWAKGMVSEQSPLIVDCAREGNCSRESVLHWINEERKKRGKENVEPLEQRISIVKGRKRTAFQVFCHENSSLVGAQGLSKMPLLGEMWRELSKDEKQEWLEKARDFSWVSSTKQKSKTIRELVAAIKGNLKSLSALGVEGYGVLLNISSSDCHVLCGSEMAQAFIDTEEDRGCGVDNSFFKYFCAQSYLKKRKKIPSYDEILALVRSELRQKYREVTGKSRIPYANLSTLGCVVTGLPQGIKFQQPKLYSSSELRKIHDHIECVHFLTVPTENKPTGTTCSSSGDSRDSERETDIVLHD